MLLIFTNARTGDERVIPCDDVEEGFGHLVWFRGGSGFGLPMDWLRKRWTGVAAVAGMRARIIIEEEEAW